MANGKISGDPIATTSVGVYMAAIQGGANVQAPSTLFAANQFNLADLSNPGQALLNLGGLSSALAASTYLTQVDAASTYLTIAAAGAGYQPLDPDLTSWAGITRAAAFDAFAASGSLLPGNGGTGQTSYTIGDTLYASGATTLSKLAKGTGYTFLRQNSAGTAPEWAAALPGYDTNSYAGANESSRLGALLTSAPTNPYGYHSDSHLGIIRDTAPLNYAGSSASFVLQHRDAAAGTLNSQLPGAVFQFTSTGNGVVNAGTELSSSVWWGLTSTHTKTGDGSGQAMSVIGGLGAYGPGLYNEFGGLCGTITNLGSLHGTMSGTELLLRDSPDGGVSHWDTNMNAIIGRIGKYHSGGTRKARNFLASSEATQPVDAILGVSTGGLAQWVVGIDLTGATFTAGQAFVIPNNTSIAARNAANSANIPMMFLSGANEIWHTGATATTGHTFANSALAISFHVAGVASSVNYIEAAGAVTTAAPLISALGSDTNIGLGHATKGTGVHSFFTNGTVKQFEVSHVATAVNYLAVSGAVAAGSPIMQTVGADANLSAIFQGKGAGGVLLLDGGGATKFRVNTTGVGFFAATPVARGAQAALTGTIQRGTFDTATVTLPQLAGVVMAIINDWRAYGLAS